MAPDLHFIEPDWPAPAAVKAFTTTRTGGVSKAPYDSFNLATHVGDDAEAVSTNRKLLNDTLQLPGNPFWLEQVHGTDVLLVPDSGQTKADACYTSEKQQVCVVMTADCLPVLFANREGTEVAAAHAGWRGLADGILEKTVTQFKSPANNLLAWLGPAISVKAFEVGEEVREIFVNKLPQSETAFKTAQPGKWYADLYELARLRLQQAGVTEIYGGEYCTYTDESRFYSYRRDGQTGRMATLIWVGACRTYD